MTSRDNITGHYAGDGEIRRRIDEQLHLSGLTDDHTVSPSDLEAVDQFHVGGLEATQELARLFSPSQGSHVLDIGSGLGGPSRYLAANYGCRVIGIDITEEYCRIASLLAARMGLEDRVEYRHGDARELLFPDGTFDGAWTQHVSMNIAEKKELYEGICRVLKIGGRFALHDVVQRTPGPILFPVPWARTQEISHLQSMETMRKTILDAGSALVAWNDVTEGALRFLDAMVARSRNAETPRLGLHLVLGPDFPEMVTNFRRNLQEERCGVVQAVFQRVS
jgi:cyclopropane fatty-acyl-phospholipid synthase-like methyltransferase